MSRIPVFLCAAALLAFAASLLLHSRMPALGDFGDWTYEGVLLRDLLLGHPHAGYLFKHYPVPNSFNTLVIAFLGLAMPWQWAAKTYLCLQLAIGFACAAHLARTTRPQPALWLILPGIFAGLNFWYGFTNFQVGVAWAMLICSRLLRREDAVWPFAPLFVLCFFTHMIPCTFAGLCYLLYVRQNWAGSWPHVRRMLLPLLPVALLTIWYVAGRFLQAHNADSYANIAPSVRYGSGAFVAYKVNTVLKSFGFVNPATNDDHSVALRLLGDQVFRVLFTVNTVLAGCACFLIARRSQFALRARMPERWFWFAVCVFAVLYAVAPGIALGVSDPGSRLFQVAAWTALFLAADRSLLSARLTRIAAACSLVLLAVNLSLFVRLASAPVAEGATQTTLAAPVAKFCHVFYEDKTQYYGDIERGQFNEDIFPTGMFLKVPK